MAREAIPKALELKQTQAKEIKLCTICTLTVSKGKSSLKPTTKHKISQTALDWKGP